MYGFAQLLRVVVVLGCGALIYVAQAFVKKRSERAALLLTVAGGVEGGFVLLSNFGLPIGWLSPLFQVGAAGTIVFALLELLDTINPKVQQLPGPLAQSRGVDSNPYFLYFIGFFALVGVLYSSLRSWLPESMSVGAANLIRLGNVAGSVIAVVAALYGSYWIAKRGSRAHWILERRPEMVVWIYVFKLTTRYQGGGTSVSWATTFALETGALVALGAISEDQAQTFVAAGAMVCPQATLGYTPENASRFASNPKLLRKAA